MKGGGGERMDLKSQPSRTCDMEEGEQMTRERDPSLTLSGFTSESIIMALRLL